ncbi:HEPN domain protein [Candidatus Vecturithrix granuli]|uniref:HEPN domain protein n=1 Tax=Vecturithrix granuli TaxID=1499967 RepID=A0A081CAW8_VECG1|nr:HEPN domain protein [Candidatus Vecturithrix granuli]
MNSACHQIDPPENTQLDIKQITQYWEVEAQEALQVADHLFEKQDFSYALFFGHLAIEKLLKALYVHQHRTHAPLLHNLHRLATLAQIELTTPRSDALILITSFNIQARYPDEQRTFRAKCTREYTEQQLKTIKEIFIWLKSQLPSATV